VNERIQEIGPYTVEAEIGRGGMGVVYRAIDTNLGRTVAIKALPEDLADDAERLARFEREARTLASLNHPNVAGIHGVEEHDGRRYLVLEYVDGETLAERLDRGPLPVDEALEMCAQIAAGVEAAHEAGIVHRDLKPANVKLASDGKVKVLDFGLAKESEMTSSSSVDLTRSPTITAALSPTLAGVILGTAPYMSPEQARGRPVDRRSDIWSFGVVLYECLTGASPFVGETVSDSIAAILQREVDLDRLPAESPSAVRRVLRRCLERDKERRYRDIGDVRLELVEVSEGRSDEFVPTAAAHGRGRAPLAWTVAAVALLALAATAGWIGFGPREAPTRLVTDIVPLDPEADVSVVSGPPALSPDGSRLAIVLEHGNEMSLFVRDLTTGEELSVAMGDDVRGPFWSPDSRSLGFFDGERMMILAPGSARSEPVPGVSVPTRNLASGAWSPDGTIIYSRIPDGLMRVRPFENEPELLLDPFPDRSGDRAVFPAFLPDGRSFLFLLFESEGEGATGVYMGSLDSNEFTLVLPVASNAVYTPSGMLIFSRAGGLQAQRFDIDAGRVEGKQIRIASDVRPVSWPPHALFTVSRERVAYVRGSITDAESEFVWMDRVSGEMTPIDVRGSLWNPGLSPDGRYLVFDWTTSETAGDIWIRDLERGVDTQLTRDPRNESQPVWTPDGRAVIFFRGNDLYRITADGVSEAELILETKEGANPWGVTPDGHTLLFSADSGDNTGVLWTQDLDTLDARQWLDRPLSRNRVSLSPDGRWVAYGEVVQDRTEVFVRAFPDGDVVQRVSVDGGDSPEWSGDGGEVLFVAGWDLMAAGIRDRADGAIEIGRPQRIGTLPPTLAGTFPFAVSPDGGRFLVIRPLSGANRSMIRLVDHWTEGGPGGVRP